MTRIVTRHITERWIIEGALRLTTPTHLGNGDADPSIDLPLVTDAFDGRAVLNGSSLAGALRHYVNEQLDGYEAYRDPDTRRDAHRERATALAANLFGERPGFDLNAAERQAAADRGSQSRLLIADALGRDETPLVVVRHGVRIEPDKRTAADKALYDLQLLDAGTTFDLSLELLIAADPPDEDDPNPTTPPTRAELLSLLALALRGLQDGAIPLGARKGRGLGECRVSGWRVWRYDLTTPDGLRGWLAHDRAGAEWQPYQQAPQTGDDIGPLLGAEPTAGAGRETFTAHAAFTIAGALLVRSGFEGEGPDVVHMGGEEGPVLPGTSLAGVMRAQARRIARTLSADQARAADLVDELFGIMPETGPGGDKDDAAARRTAGRVRVTERPITNGLSLVQNRVKIDRFTGGAADTALFEEQPIFGGGVEMAWTARRALPAGNEIDADRRFRAEVGLLLLTLKDLWTGFLPVGGGANVGRGRLRGLRATLTHSGGAAGRREWTVRDDNGRLTIDGPDGLNDYVKALSDHLGAGGQA